MPVSTFKILHTILLSLCFIYLLQCMCLASLMIKVSILQYSLQWIFMTLLLLVWLYSSIICFVYAKCFDSFLHPFFVSGHLSLCFCGKISELWKHNSSFAPSVGSITALNSLDCSSYCPCWVSPDPVPMKSHQSQHYQVCLEDWTTWCEETVRTNLQ